MDKNKEELTQNVKPPSNYEKEAEEDILASNLVRYN